MWNEFQSDILLCTLLTIITFGLVAATMFGLYYVTATQSIQTEYSRYWTEASIGVFMGIVVSTGKHDCSVKRTQYEWTEIGHRLSYMNILITTNRGTFCYTRFGRTDSLFWTNTSMWSSAIWQRYLVKITLDAIQQGQKVKYIADKYKLTMRHSHAFSFLSREFFFSKGKKKLKLNSLKIFFNLNFYKIFVPFCHVSYHTVKLC